MRCLLIHFRRRDEEKAEPGLYYVRLFLRNLISLMKGRG